MRTQDHATREIGAALAAAPDRTLGRIVGIVDGLNDRGAADALLAAARPRLRDLRPPRPLRFTRLLAIPLEVALVASDSWRGAADGVPRNGLSPLGAAMHAALGEFADDIEAAALGHSMADVEVVARLGARLWPLAAATDLPAVLPGWGEAGLPEDQAPGVVTLCRPLWRGGAAAWAARNGA
jgi:hypothetical protein